MPKSTENDHHRRPRVVILGGGFAGVGAAHEAEACRRRRRADRQAQLPHVPAAPVPMRLRPPRDHRRGARAARPGPRPGQRDHPPGDRHRGRSGRARGAVRGSGTADVRLPRVRPRGRGELLRDGRGGGARVPDVHAPRRHAAQEPHPGALGGGRPGSRARGRRRAQHRRRGRRCDGGRERRRARRALPRQLRQGLSEGVPGQGPRHPRRGRPDAVSDVQGRHPRVHREGPREAHRSR